MAKSTSQPQLSPNLNPPPQVLSAEQLEKDPLNKGLGQSIKSRKQLLDEMTTKELQDIYHFEFGGADPGEMTDEQLRDAINGAAPYAPAPTREPDPVDKSGSFEVKDKKGNIHRINNGSKGMVVVRQVNIREVEGNIVELANSEVIQTYTPDMFQKMLDQKFFQESKIHVEVLHGQKK